MYLEVDQFHSLYYEVYGKTNSIPFLFLHGGPGLGFTDNDKRFFNPEKHKVIFLDQRGCGRSKPKGELIYNTTQILITDISRLLDHLDIEEVVIFGGSWGATLGILFAAKKPRRVSSLILRGVFSATFTTADLFIKGKIKTTHPKIWERVLARVPKGDKEEVANYYFNNLIQNKEQSFNLGYEWVRYGLALSRKHISEWELDKLMANYKGEIDGIIIQLFYALEGFFLPDNYLYEQASSIKVPTTFIHGTYDYLCPIEDARLLNKIIPQSRLIECNAGHSSGEEEIEKALKMIVSSYS